MKLFKFIKGYMKKREVSRRKPNKDFEIETSNYNKELPVKVTYCNNYPDIIKDATSISNETDINYISDIILSVNKSTEVMSFICDILLQSQPMPLIIMVKDNVVYIEGSIQDFINVIHIFDYSIIQKNPLVSEIKRVLANYPYYCGTKNTRSISIPERFKDNIISCLCYPKSTIDILFVQDEECLINNSGYINNRVAFSIQRTLYMDNGPIVMSHNNINAFKVNIGKNQYRYVVVCTIGYVLECSYNKIENMLMEKLLTSNVTIDGESLQHIISRISDSEDHLYDDVDEEIE